MPSIEVSKFKPVGHGLAETQSQMKWALGMALCFLLFWGYQLPSFMKNEFPETSTFTVLQVSNSAGRVTQAHSNTSDMTLSGISVRKARRDFGTAEIKLPTGSKKGDTLRLHAEWAAAQDAVILGGDEIKEGKVVVIATTSDIGEKTYVSLVHADGTRLPKEQVDILRAPKKYLKADYGVEFSAGAPDHPGFITLVSPVIENWRLSGINTSIRNTVPCGSPCTVPLDDNGNTIVAAFKLLKLNSHVMSWAIFFVMVLGFFVYVLKSGNIGVFIACSALLSMRLFMAVSLMKNQVDYAAQVFLVTAELLIIPTLLANLESLRLYLKSDDVLPRPAISVFLPPMLSVLLLSLWWLVCAMPDVDEVTNSVAYFVALNWNNFARKLPYWVELGFVVGLLIAYLGIFKFERLRSRMLGSSGLWFCMLIAIAIIATLMSSFGAKTGQLPGAGLIVLLAPGCLLLFARRHYHGGGLTWWTILPFALIGLIVILLAPTKLQDFGAVLVYAPALIFAGYIIYILPGENKKSGLWHFWDFLSVFFAIVSLVLAVYWFHQYFNLDLSDEGKRNLFRQFGINNILVLGAMAGFLGALWKIVVKPLDLLTPLFVFCLLTILTMLYIKSSVVSEIHAQIKGQSIARGAAINKISTEHLLCFFENCEFGQWLLPIVLTEELGNKSSITADRVAKIDAELLTEYKRHGDGVNNKMRLYGWLLGHPFDRVLFSGSYGRLQALERAKASSIPHALFEGDASVARSEKISRSASALDGYQYEHAVGINLIRPLGLSGCVFIWLALAYLFKSIPKENQAGRYLIALLLLASVWLLLQTQGVFPISGQSLPLLTVNSFAKDFFPILMALIIYLSFFSGYLRREHEVAT